MENNVQSSVVKWNNINTLDKYTFPDKESNVLFYLRDKHSVYYGTFKNNKFIAYSTRAGIDQKSFYMNIIGEYSVDDVDCYINIKDLKPMFSDDINSDIDNEDVYSNLIIIKYHIGDMDDFYTVVNNESVPIEHKDNQQYLRLPKLPEYCFNERLVNGKYVMVFCDDSDGFFTYNIYKKGFIHLFDKTIFVTEAPCRASAYEDIMKKFNELLSTIKIN